MTTQKMDEILKSVLASVFGVPIEQINEDSSPDTIDSWDSLHHMNLIIALEEEFGIEFTDQEMVDSLNFEMLRIIIKDKLIL